MPLSIPKGRLFKSMCFLTIKVFMQVNMFFKMLVCMCRFYKRGDHEKNCFGFGEYVGICQ